MRLSQQQQRGEDDNNVVLQLKWNDYDKVKE